MRRLTPDFMNALNNDKGILHPLLVRVHEDDTLDLEIRNNYLNIYYRGGNLLRIKDEKGGFTAFFDDKYRKRKKAAPRPVPKYPKRLRSRTDVNDLLDVMPLLKQLMDFYLVEYRKPEREYQQLIVRDNNFAKLGKASDYFVCDIEYAGSMQDGGKTRRFRYDMVAVHWPSEGSIRKQGNDRRLVLVEVKYGGGALKGNAGLTKHVEDVDAFLGNMKRAQSFKEEMCGLFNQKRELDLIMSDKTPPRALLSFSPDKPILLILLANQDPDSKVLGQEIRKIKAPKNAELRFAAANFMGYGLFDPALLTLDEMKAMIGKHL